MPNNVSYCIFKPVILCQSDIVTKSYNCDKFLRHFEMLHMFNISYVKSSPTFDVPNQTNQFVFPIQVSYSFDVLSKVIFSLVYILKLDIV